MDSEYNNKYKYVSVWPGLKISHLVIPRVIPLTPEYNYDAASIYFKSTLSVRLGIREGGEIGGAMKNFGQLRGGRP